VPLRRLSARKLIEERKQHPRVRTAARRGSASHVCRPTNGHRARASPPPTGSCSKPALTRTAFLDWDKTPSPEGESVDPVTGCACHSALGPGDAEPPITIPATAAAGIASVWIVVARPPDPILSRSHPPAPLTTVGPLDKLSRRTNRGSRPPATVFLAYASPEQPSQAGRARSTVPCGPLTATVLCIWERSHTSPS
jgi:hypothetical protein